MKILPYILGAIMVTSCIDLIFTTHTGNLYACPRCRRALPKGPRKQPHPNFFNTNRPKKSAYMPSESINSVKKVEAILSDSCVNSCCCTQQKTSSTRQNKETVHE